MALLTTLVLAVSTLLGGFRNPPQEARPQTWWHWMKGNVSREGIVADLDAMAAIGLGGVTIFDAGCDVPEGPLCFGTEEWFDTVRFAAHEAHRRGLEVILSNCSGWSSSGGPWIAPSNSMMFVEFGSVDVTGPGWREVGLPPIRSKGGAELSVKGLLVQIPEQAMSKLFFVRKRRIFDIISPKAGK